MHSSKKDDHLRQEESGRHLPIGYIVQRTLERFMEVVNVIGESGIKPFRCNHAVIQSCQGVQVVLDV